MKTKIQQVEEAREVLRALLVDLVDHGKVTVELGTDQSAAIIQLVRYANAETYAK